jgi:hypothetical protein
MKAAVPVIEVSDRGGAIFGAGLATFVTTRRARPEFVRGAIVRVREDTGRKMFRTVDRGEWVVRDAVPENGRNGAGGLVRLTLHRLAEASGRRTGGHGSAD